ncbi:MAG: HAD family phosphatase [Verrucomicrobiia bacterium]
MAATTIRAVVFDMDGVLIDAKEWHYEALNRALRHFGYTISRYDHLVTFDGLPTRTKLKMLSMEHGLPEALHEFLNALKQEYTMEIVHAKCKPTFQHEFALSKLKQAGYKLAVASNSVRRSVEVMMERSALAPYLDTMLSNEDVKHGKPAPDMYLAAAEKLGFPPSQCLVVEDNPKGIEAAEKAGCPVLVVDSVLDVTLDRIQKAICEEEGG